MRTIAFASLVAAVGLLACTSKDNVLTFGGGGQGTGGKANGTGGKSSSAGHDGMSSGSGGASGNDGKGGMTGRACDQTECLRANQCVRTCDAPVEYTGCCACEAPLFDFYDGCGARSGSGGGGGATAGGRSGTTGGTTGSGGAATAGKSGSTGGTPGTGGGNGTGGTTATGGKSGGGTGGTFACDASTISCLRPYVCVLTCGDPAVPTGCCPCQPPAFDNFQGMGCGGAGGGAGAGGNGGAGGATCEQLKTGYANALTEARSCYEARSSSPPCSVMVASVLGCSCQTYVDTIAPLQPYIDAWKKGSCQSDTLCSAVLCLAPKPQTCDTTGSATPLYGVCRDAP